MSEYVSRCSLEVNGASIEDFKSVTPKKLEIWKQVPLMNKTGFLKKTPRHQIEVEYVKPDAAEEEFDFSAVEDGTLTVLYENGQRITYTGVYIMEIGDEKIDGENETTVTILLGAAEKNEE